MKIPFRSPVGLNALSTWAFLAMLCLNAANAADIAHLTGVKLFSTNDLNGNFNGIHWYDTVGGNTGWNVYLVDATGGMNGSFINTGNGASTSIDIPLNLGTYSFWMFNASESANYWGLNLFFDSDQINPKITAITTKKTGATDPPFTTNPASQVPILANNTTAASANSLVFTTNGALITLTSFFFADESVFQMDRVSSFDSIPGGTNNSVSFMTLTVSNVPEPSTYALGTIATALLGYISRRRKTKRVA